MGVAVGVGDSVAVGTGVGVAVGVGDSVAVGTGVGVAVGVGNGVAVGTGVGVAVGVGNGVAVGSGVGVAVGGGSLFPGRTITPSLFVGSVVLELLVRSPSPAKVAVAVRVWIFPWRCGGTFGGPGLPSVDAPVVFQSKPTTLLTLPSSVSALEPMSLLSVSSVKVRVKVASAAPLFSTVTLMVIS